jgi:hypothetical protein
MMGQVALMQRCMKRLEEVLTVEERMKVLRVLASTANCLADSLELDEQLKEIDNAKLV